ncbi:MAG: restriction endonuclease subunit S [Aquipseudomonas alcaligenes]|uniref:Restriction endonuclease subunit S n=1 Tax=Aquipseudomonas alcaligenes TaxID=43263 RepID=A0A5C7W0G1_AQUAC|nr:MAG: restriction endonuclease subunit S [Pseudomonas alcaligenes]
MSAEVKPGYKHSDVGIIPEDWDVVSLGEIGQCFIGLTYSPRDVQKNGTLVLRSSNIQGGDLVFDDNVYVDTEIPEKILVQDGDILICVRNGSRRLIGKCALLDKRVAGQTFGAFMSVFRTPDSAFTFHQFQSDLVKRQIEENIGATINQITNANLNAFKIPFPTDPYERAAIASVLSNIDTLISSLDQLIIKKRNILQATMQQLLTGQHRLPGFNREWEVRRLGEIGAFLKGSGVTRDQSGSGELPCVRYGEIYTSHHNVVRVFQSFISREVANNATPLKEGDILFAGSGETKAEIGKCVAFVDSFEAYAGGDIVILRPISSDSTYLGYALNTQEISRQKASRGQGDAVVHISANALNTVEIRLPPKDEQIAIATILSDMDTELASLVARSNKARLLKYGIMQELLTGRIRLTNKAPA